MPEYLKKRLGGKRIRLYSSVLSLVEYILHNISVISLYLSHFHFVFVQIVMSKIQLLSRPAVFS